MSQENIATLDTAMAEIEATLKKHDLAAVIVIHKQGLHQSSLVLKTSYTAAECTPEGRIKFELDPVHFPSPESAVEVLKNTSNMLYHLSFKTHDIAHRLKDASKGLDARVNARHTEFKSV